jgi:hypothetical protein
MFNLKDMGDLGKIAGQAKELQRQQDQKHQEQMGVLKHIATTLDQILTEMRKSCS